MQATMSRFVYVAAGLVLTLAVATPSSANLLVNPGFETDAVSGAAPVAGATGWDTSGETASSPMDPVRSGIGSLKLTSNGNFEVPTALQEFPASPGEEYNMNGWMLTPTALPSNITFGLLKIVFRDAAGMDLEPASVSIGQFGPPADPGVESLPFLDDLATPNEWIFTEAQGVAPAGTESVLFLAINVGVNGCNYQVRELAETVASSLSGVSIDINQDAPPDKRSYQVDFSLYGQLAPGHLPRYDLKASVEGLIEGFERMAFADAQFRESQYMRLKVLTSFRDRGLLDEDLRWSHPKGPDQVSKVA